MAAEAHGPWYIPALAKAAGSSRQGTPDCTIPSFPLVIHTDQRLLATSPSALETVGVLADLEERIELHQIALLLHPGLAPRPADILNATESSALTFRPTVRVSRGARRAVG